MADQSSDLPEMNEVSFDSGALNGLAAIIHRFETPGAVTATVLHADTPIQEVALIVPPGVRGTAPQALIASGTPEGGRQASPAIDLYELAQTPPAAPGTILAAAQPGAAPGRTGPALDPSGYGMFCATLAPQGVAFLAKPAAAAAPGAQEYDSRQLVPGDYFVVALLRPGTYTVSNLVNGAKGQITLAAQAGGVGTSYQAPEALIVQCAAGGFEPASVQLQPLQGLAFQCTTPARIKIDWLAAASTTI